MQFNILQHNLVPKCNILSEEDENNLMIELKIKTKKQLPEISRFDPQALALCLRPGNIAKFTRKSITALETVYYRVCV